MSQWHKTACSLCYVNPIAGTPHHKDMPVRLERATAAEVAAAARDAEVVHALISGHAR